MRGEGKPFWKKGSLPPSSSPHPFQKLLLGRMTGQGTLMAFRWLAVPAVVRAGEVAARETDARPGTGGFPAPGLFLLRASGCCAPRCDMKGHLLLWTFAISCRYPGPLSASLWWKMESPDAGRTLAAYHMPCAPFAWGSDTSSSPSGQRRGPSIPVRAKVFSGWGEHASGGAVLLRKAPLPRVFCCLEGRKDMSCR